MSRKDSRIAVVDTRVFVRLINGPRGEGQIGFLMSWYEALDFAEALVDACDEAKSNAEKLNLIPYDRKNR